MKQICPAIDQVLDLLSAPKYSQIFHCQEWVLHWDSLYSCTRKRLSSLQVDVWRAGGSSLEAQEHTTSSWSPSTLVIAGLGAKSVSTTLGRAQNNGWSIQMSRQKPSKQGMVLLPSQVAYKKLDSCSLEIVLNVPPLLLFVGILWISATNKALKDTSSRACCAVLDAYCNLLLRNVLRGSTRQMLIECYCA